MANGNGKNGVDPTVIVIFGATGDLAQRKLYPALFDLYSKSALPKKFELFAFARREFSAESYRQFVRVAIVAKRSAADEVLLSAFLARVKYVKGLFEDDASYTGLAKELAHADRDFNICSNKLFYLAVPPSLYENILQRLSRSGLTIPCSDSDGWTRVLIEKPFGSDIETARRLNRLLGKLFHETQIFRIDHYLAKEALQNILAFRFSNSLFEPVWNRRHIERVEIRMFEKSSVGKRGPFYDGIGALRDVGQNHLLTMLTLIAMEYPKGMTASAIQRERARVLRQLTPVNGVSVRKVVRGQYGGYRAEPGVNADSQTETLFSMTASLKNPRWKGVPFLLSAGKALSETKTEIEVHFKDVDTGRRDVKSHRNTLTFRIQPNEGISVLFWVKTPGVGKNSVHPQTLSFRYADAAETRDIPDAYEQVLYDCIRGDQTLFASTDEEEAAWRFITPILTRWGKNPMRRYEPGTDFKDIIK